MNHQLENLPLIAHLPHSPLPPFQVLVVVLAEMVVPEGAPSAQDTDRETVRGEVPTQQDSQPGE